mmetsp:Transcript_12846/g.37741  ORF Transcript_12846/g.37741 Transcript_12846/m.37741 type:complete len:241 (-) Transcript_12846:220-942(-)
MERGGGPRDANKVLRGERKWKENLGEGGIPAPACYGWAWWPTPWRTDGRRRWGRREVPPLRRRWASRSLRRGGRTASAPRPSASWELPPSRRPAGTASGGLPWWSAPSDGARPRRAATSGVVSPAPASGVFPAATSAPWGVPASAPGRARWAAPSTRELPSPPSGRAWRSSAPCNSLKSAFIRFLKNFKFFGIFRLGGCWLLFLVLSRYYMLSVVKYKGCKFSWIEKNNVCNKPYLLVNT